MSRPDLRSLLIALEHAEPAKRARVLDRLSPADIRALAEEWEWQAHGSQQEPGGSWRVWMIMAGRGFGKTRTGAEWVSGLARQHPEARIALVGASLADVASVMVEGPSGILSVAQTGEAPRWIASRGLLEFSSGAKAFAYSGAAPEQLRGPEHHFAWADELAKWTRAEAAWDNLQLGLRCGERPRTLVTTTPKPMALLTRIKAMPDTEERGGRTAENLHLPNCFAAEMEAIYGGTRLGRQELWGELIEDVEGALWSRALIEGCRVPAIAPGDGGERALRRIVVGVDPPASADGDACGIVVCGLGEDGTGYVLADCTVSGLSPEGWARAAARAADLWEADRVIAEKNMGGDMVESVLRSVDPRLPVTLVSASRGKSARAEPVAARFETGAARLAGHFPELEDQLAGLTAGGAYHGPGRSPDRADACIWALTELLLKQRPEPRVRLL
ncbi:MAG TPA: terminase family protein [Allosphingosinicella sp.]